MVSLLDLRRLRYFVAVAEELHFGRAAKRLRISQPPLSLQIQALERELDAQLFDRTRQRTHLTAAGRLLLQRAKAILAEVEEVRAEVKSAATGKGGDLRIGFTASSGLMAFFHRALHRFRRDYPEVRLLLQEMPSAMQIEALHARNLDLAIARHVAVPQRRGLNVDLLCEDVLVVAVHASNPVATKKSVSAKDLRDQSFIAYPREAGIGIAQTIFDLTGAAGFYPKIVQEARDSSTIIGLVAAGLGIGIVPSSLACIRMPGVKFLALRDAAARTSVHVASRAQEGGQPGAEMQGFLLKEAAKEYDAGKLRRT